MCPFFRRRGRQRCIPRVWDNRVEQPHFSSGGPQSMTTSTRPGQLAAHTPLKEPLLAFSSGSPSMVDAHPLRGLLQHGPYSKNSFASHTDRVRLAIIGPESSKAERRRVLQNLQTPHQPSDRRDYVPPYPGFESLFSVPLVPAVSTAQLTWPARLSDLGPGLPTDQVREAISQNMRRLATLRDEFDIAIVHLPDEWRPGLKSEGFNAHDELKAVGAELAIPTPGAKRFHVSFWVCGLPVLEARHRPIR